MIKIKFKNIDNYIYTNNIIGVDKLKYDLKTFYNIKCFDVIITEISSFKKPDISKKL